MRHRACCIDDGPHASPDFRFNFLASAFSVYPLHLLAAEVFNLACVSPQNIGSEVVNDGAQCLRHKGPCISGLQVEQFLCVQEFFDGG